MKPLGKKKIELLLGQLKEIRRDATMEAAYFRENTEFIKKETGLWRETWIVSPLDDIISSLEDAIK